jgi:hypothetical protein
MDKKVILTYLITYSSMTKMIASFVHILKNLSVLCKMTWLVPGDLLGPEKQAHMYNIKKQK